jgi:hypothetical protein
LDKLIPEALVLLEVPPGNPLGASVEVVGWRYCRSLMQIVTADRYCRSLLQIVTNLQTLYIISVLKAGNSKKSHGSF